MKRIFAVILCLMMLTAVSAASAVTDMPEGTTVIEMGQSFVDIPTGLEAMYQMMTGAKNEASSYSVVIRPKNGYVLMSYTETPVDKNYTIDELQGFGSQIQAAIERQVQYCQMVEMGVDNNFDTPALHLETLLTVNGNQSSSRVVAQGFVMCVGKTLVEIWVMTSGDNEMLYDEAAAAARTADIEDIETVLGLLHFADTEASTPAQTTEMAASTAAVNVQLPESELWTDPEGRFSLQIPVGCTVLTAANTQEEFDAVGTQFAAANLPGADKAYSCLTEDIIPEKSVVIFTPDMKAAVEIYLVHDSGWQGVTTANLAMLDESIRQDFEGRMGFAMILVSKEGEMISGIEHSRSVYVVRSDEYTYQTAVLAAVDGDLLVEADVSAAADSEWFDVIYRMVVDSLTYYAK